MAQYWELVVTVVVALLASEWFGKLIIEKFSKTSNKKILERVDKLDKKIDMAEANRARERILSFNTELLRNLKHSKEEYTDILASIDSYEHYCKENPDYPNNRAILAIENIKHCYTRCSEQHDFL